MLSKYHEIIDTLVARFAGANSMKVIQPFSLHPICMLNHVLIRSNGGPLYYAQPGHELVQLLPNEFLLIPARQPVNLAYGKADMLPITGASLMANYTSYLTPLTQLPIDDATSIGFSYINFDVEVLEYVNLFDILDLPTFTIPTSVNFLKLFEYVLEECYMEKLAKVHALNHATNLLAVEIIRYIYQHRLFVDRLVAKLKYLQDKRILDILKYINKNLNKDLYNKVLAGIANISEDYMGQYFKLAINERPQAYVEHQRMRQALHLLQATSQSIETISKEIGLKDTAYFCRRFKNLFGIQASKARNRSFIFSCQLQE
ncbi:MAG: helix-turn-helix transcriptional regulator [Candidatus Amoebophilus sp.]